MKYIQTRHWDYWYSVYELGEYTNANAGEVEFTLTNDKEGKEAFFHLELYNLATLESIIEENDFIGKNEPDYPNFIAKYQALKAGEIDYFIGGLYYPMFQPSLEDCQLQNNTVFEKKSPACPPYYAIVFVGENSALLPETVTQWVEKLSQPLFGQPFKTDFAAIPSQKAAEEAFFADARCE